MIGRFKFLLFLALCFCLDLTAQDSAAVDNTYLDSDLPVSDRVENLLMQMSVEEKAGQLLFPLGWPMYEKTNDQVSVSELYKKEITERHIGGLWATLRADPWTQKTLETGLSPKQAAKATNAIQRYAVEETRLGIPLLLAEESMHGHMAIGATTFPTGIGQASTWNPDLIEDMATAIAAEVRAQGGNIGYGPILDISRDPRWSRVEETFGEDPFLTAEMGKAIVSGFQGDDVSQKDKIVATMKHFIAYGASEGGHNGGAVITGERDLFQNMLYPVKEVVDAGILSVMTAYSSVDGIPSTAHEKLLKGLLKEQWGFDGFVISDLGSIEGLLGSHHIAGSLEDAAAISIKAGVDADLGGKAYHEPLLEAIEDGRVDMKTLDNAVRKILEIKFRLGLFENPYVDENEAVSIVNNERNQELALEVARQSITLLKNEGNLLPLNKNIKKIAVLGPNADVQYNQLGDYTAPQSEEKVFTVLDGIRNALPDAEVVYSKGTGVRDTIQTDIRAAVELARLSEVAIVVLGGSSARDFKTEYQETGAASISENEDILSDMESGEGFDRSTLHLMGKQLELLDAVVATGTPTVLVLIKGRPLLLNRPVENVSAILDTWYPGEQGGNAIADVLFGDYNPAGRLPISVPKSEGQLPVYYNQLNPHRRDYIEIDSKALFPFGFGLSYTNFSYSNLQVKNNASNNDNLVNVQLDIRNTGHMGGDEVVQLYVSDLRSSVVTSVKRLAGFQRINLKPDEKKTVKFTLQPKHLALYNIDMDRVVESGKFLLEIGASSEDLRVSETFEIEQEIKLD
ncbi:glycoside hydrolase family 3 N-terminal domain-containing protein [Autumnicola musiva]|uniref:Glycoside hydrolase family 3 N-terminal domain-containing protein n=1 Tax=Autumnicola musiva TaxID=3075589 RepID=A0ABU3D2X0_9FLAO|nr:glycoside hydrolase family 3 N-terminal domain-containing protein [Zunongwangia sp. F117]MDT0675884.1 glycoside hydrolase family 3 N-terminal domain-containing protein [Zunongwangia sp. F117]